MLVTIFRLTHFCVQTGNSISLLSCFDQVELLGRGEIVGRNISPVVPQPRRKWLNIVFDLNGVLCECTSYAFAKKFKKPHRFEDNVLSPTTPTMVGPKGVFARQNVNNFLHEVSQFAQKIVIWSSMKKSTAEDVVNYLFHHLQSPFDILGQEQCKRIETSKRRYLGYPNDPSKHIYLKVLSKQFFRDY